MSFISCMIVLTRVYRAVLNRGSESVHTCLFHGLRIKAFNISPLSYDVCCKFVIYGFYCVEIPCIPNLLSLFFFKSWKDLVFYWLLFLHLLEWSYYFFIIHSIKCGVSHLCMLNHPCTPWINPFWLWCIILIICCWIWFPNILLRVFVFLFIRDIGL